MFFLSWKDNSPVPAAHTYDKSKLLAPETLWEGRLGLLAFVHVAVDTTGIG